MTNHPLLAATERAMKCIDVGPISAYQTENGIASRALFLDDVRTLATYAAEQLAGPKEGLKWLGLDEARRSIPSGTLVLNRRRHGEGSRWLYGEIYNVSWEDDCYNEIFTNQFLALDTPTT